MSGKVIDISEVKKSIRKPATITFKSALTRNENGENVVYIQNVRVENGDVFGVLDEVIKDGGLFYENDNGSISFIPWPCAHVDITYG